MRRLNGRLSKGTGLSNPQPARQKHLWPALIEAKNQVAFDPP